MIPRYKRSEKAIFTEVGSDIVALHVERGHCYGLEKVTAAVWKLLAEPASLDEICRHLIGAYEVDPKVCRADVERLIGQFRNEGLIEAVTAPQ